MPGFAAFLRAVNVGGTGAVKMAELKALLETLGFADVSTLLQSGNAAFSAPSAAAADPQRIASAFAKRFGFAPKIIVRSAAQLAAILKKNPWPKEAEKDPSHMLVMLLDGAPAKAAFGLLRETYQGPESLHLSGEELYLYYPNGMGRSKLTNVLIEKKLGVSGTARNWNTIGKMADAARALK